MTIPAHDETMFFVLTGTGRCGTELFARLLSMSPSAECHHEKYFSHDAMLNFFTEGKNYSHLIKNVVGQIIPTIFDAQKRNVKLGVASGHAYFHLPVLEKILPGRVKYILLTRKPDEFVRSALARGFFDETHQNYCNQISPHTNSEIGRQWQQMSAFEKCAWYWGMVNTEVLNFFEQIEQEKTRVVRIEDLSLDTVRNVCNFLDINDIPDSLIQECISKKYNASPGEHGVATFNPNSILKKTPTISSWSTKQLKILTKYTLQAANSFHYIF